MEPGLIAQAINRLPPPYSKNAEEVLLLLAAGYGIIEVGRRLDMPWKAVSETKRQIGDQLIRVLVEEEGYTENEAIRFLRVPSAVVLDAVRGDTR